MLLTILFFFFFFNDTATTEIYTLSLHDALPIYARRRAWPGRMAGFHRCQPPPRRAARRDHDRLSHRALLHGVADGSDRSEEHTSELQSRQYLVCRLLLEKKKNNKRMLAITLYTT